MTTPVLWPRDLLPASSWSAGYDPLAASGGRLALSGRLNNGGAPGRGIWRPAWIDAPVWEQDQREALLALEAQVIGRDRPILVPYLHKGYGPFVAAPSRTTLAGGSVLKDLELVSPRTVALARRGADAGDIMVDIAKIECGALKSGHAFTIGDFLYKVRSVEEQDANRALVEIMPELRVDIAADDWAEFDRPTVKCKIVDPRALSPEWSAAGMANLTVQFIEDTTPS